MSESQGSGQKAKHQIGGVGGSGGKGPRRVVERQRKWGPSRLRGGGKGERTSGRSPIGEGEKASTGICGWEEGAFEPGIGAEDGLKRTADGEEKTRLEFSGKSSWPLLPRAVF